MLRRPSKKLSKNVSSKTLKKDTLKQNTLKKNPQKEHPEKEHPEKEHFKKNTLKRTPWKEHPSRSKHRRSKKDAQQKTLKTKRPKQSAQNKTHPKKHPPPLSQKKRPSLWKKAKNKKDKNNARKQNTQKQNAQNKTLKKTRLKKQTIKKNVRFVRRASVLEGQDENEFLSSDWRWVWSRLISDSRSRHRDPYHGLDSSIPSRQDGCFFLHSVSSTVTDNRFVASSKCKTKTKIFFTINCAPRFLRRKFIHDNIETSIINYDKFLRHQCKCTIRRFQEQIRAYSSHLFWTNCSTMEMTMVINLTTFYCLEVRRLCMFISIDVWNTLW